MNNPAPDVSPKFSGYQKVVVGMLAFLQFAVILDFMLMSPLGALIMPSLSITPAQFGSVVSAYAFAAGVSGLLTAVFADRFDRKKLLLFFYAGFIAGTLWCGLAKSFESLLLARIANALFAPPIIVSRLDLIPTTVAERQALRLHIGIYPSHHCNRHVTLPALD